jgi:hypothetical protein
MWCSVSAAAVSATASANRIPRGQRSVVSVAYRFTSVPGTSVTSAQGLFRVASAAGPVTVGTVNTRVTASTPIPPNFVTGSGRTTESIDIPLGLLEQVIAQGITRFYFERSFTTAAAAAVGTARVDFQIISESAADLSIKKIDLYFENRRPEVTIEKGHKGLKAFADISYAGTGLFEGYWEVDGRVISRVFQQLSFGGLLKLQTPDIPELPTFDPGTHRIRFVITRPAQNMPTPVIIYFVNLDRFKPATSTIGLLSPQDRAIIEYGPQKFEWQRSAKAVVFLVQYGDKLESKTLFSAYARDAFYVLPDAVLKTSFKAGERYYWKVIAFDEENIIIGESTVQSFTFRTELGSGKGEKEAGRREQK